jgi:hypothetical protein
VGGLTRGHGIPATVYSVQCSALYESRDIEFGEGAVGKGQQATHCKHPLVQTQQII